jgi:peptidoglycan/xylan/chitin deacetylase (PgdA/CDA1 family)
LALVLCYHAISDSWNDPLAVRPAAFASQLATLLRRRYRPGAIDPDCAGARTFHVTFDDAYRSIAEVVPVLDRYRARATIFVATAYADGGKPLMIPELVGRSSGNELATMDWTMLRGLADHGIEIGSHTVSHAHLPDLSAAELKRELEESREHVEDELRRPCRYVAYPFGENDARVREAARTAGYSAGFSLRPTAKRDDVRFAYPRVEVYRPDGPLRFAVKTSPLRRPAIAVRDRLAASRRRRAAVSARRTP